MLTTKFRFIWQSGFREEDLNKSGNQKQEDWLISKKIFPSVATWPNDWLISKTTSPLKSLGQMNRNLVGSILGRSSIKIANLVPIRLQTWPPQTILVSKKSSPL
jgi:hypothetical protein